MATNIEECLVYDKNGDTEITLKEKVVTAQYKYKRRNMKQKERIRILYKDIKKAFDNYLRGW